MCDEEAGTAFPRLRPSTDIRAAITTSEPEDRLRPGVGPELAAGFPVRIVAWLCLLMIVVGPVARAESGSTIRLKPRSEPAPAEDEERRKKPAPPPAEEPPPAESPPTDSEPPAEPDATVPAPPPTVALPSTPADLRPAALDRVPAQPPRKKAPAGAIIVLALSVGAAIAGGFFLAEAGRNLNSDNYTLDVDDSGGDLEVSVSDEFAEAQEAVVVNGLAGTAFISVGVAGILASILALTN